MSALRTRLAKLERTMRIDLSEELANQARARVQFFAGLGRVLEMDSEAKGTVSTWLESWLEQRAPGSTDDKHFCRELLAVLAQYPAAQTAVGQWLKSQRFYPGNA